MNEPRLTRSRTEFGVALLLQIAGAAAVLLVSTRSWQTITTIRSKPFRPDVLEAIGRTIDAAPTALGLVGLAGVVAVLATRGLARRVVGVLVLFAGAATVWRSITALPAVSSARAASIVRDKHSLVANTAVLARHVTTHPQWGALSIAGGIAIIIAGALVALRGADWGGMSARYEAPVDQRSTATNDEDDDRARARAQATLWTALERGHDPTADDPTEST